MKETIYESYEKAEKAAFESKWKIEHYFHNDMRGREELFKIAEKS